MKTSRQTVFRKLAALYERMADAYAGCAENIGLSCEGCEDNCCTSYFQHHTYVEWAYLWQGLKALPEERRLSYEQRAREYVAAAHRAIGEGRRPDAMCPLNDDGLCGVYKHRLMICRMHGVPNFLVNPRGQRLDFPGCFKSQELSKAVDVTPFDRTPLYRDLVGLEMAFVGKKIRSLPKVDMTLAEMIVMGPPQV